MGQDPNEIRHDIEETRARMGDTAEALGHRADVPGRTKEAISDRVESVKSTISGSTPDKGDVKQGTQRAAGMAKENPLGLAIGATAVGFVAGLLIPSTRMEDENIGPMADQVKDKARETGEEALERGKHVAQEAAQTVKDEGKQQAQEMAPSS
jgi:ElaB/YqjD/DUF883 family membrane-anchored ribosome-binding protein